MKIFSFKFENNLYMSDNKTVNKQLKTAIFNIKRDFKLKQAEVADKLGVKSTYLSDMINGGVPFTESISKKIKVETTKDFMLLENEVDDYYNKRIPFWNLPVSAGRSIIDIIGSLKPDGYISGLPGAEIAENILPVIGTSMEPEISSGAIIGVRKMNNWDTLNTARIYLIITKDDRMIKRIEHDSNESDILWCISPNYPRFKILKSEIIEIHRVCFVYNAK